MSHRRSPRRGFSLIELLVVIGIIAMLTGMTMTAMQSAREAARRVSCQSNLGQLAKGLLQFQHDNNRFPNAGTFGENPVVVARGDINSSAIQNVFNGQFGTFTAQETSAALASDVGPLYSWVVSILPYIDQGDRFTRWDPKRVYFDNGGRTIGGVLDSGDRVTNLNLSKQSLPNLVCPSDAAATPREGHLSYVVNGGFSRWHSRPDLGWTGANGDPVMPATGVGPDWAVSDAIHTGVMFLGTSGNRARWDASTRPSSLYDGAGQTVLLSENLLGGASPGSRYSDNTVTNWACPHPNFSMFMASDNICKGGCASGGLRPSGGGGIDGANWVEANRPGSFEAINDFKGLRDASSFPFPSSQHTGGVNVGMCDGSVRFIKETIHGAIWSKLITPAGGLLLSLERQLPLDQDAIDGQ